MPSPEQRFWAKVDRRGPDECWPWRTSVTSMGYGQLRVGARKIVAHRVSYEMHKGPVPEGLELDHLCRNRACVNPAHLEPVPHRVNVLRGEGLAAQRARQTKCIHGHDFDLLNTYVTPDGRRQCRSCRRVSATNWLKRKEAHAI